MSLMRPPLWAVMALITLGWQGQGNAHYCSNIFAGPARLVIKPERSSVQFSGSSPVELKVFLQNNFPYRLSGVEMRGEASGYSIQVSPQSQSVYPSQLVLYTFTITPDGAGGGEVHASDLNLQVRIRVGDFRGEQDTLVDQEPSTQTLLSGSIYEGGGEQTPSFSAAVLGDKYPNTSLPQEAPFFGRTGLGQLIHWFGYRFCYDTDGAWRCGSQDCPSPCSEGDNWNDTSQFPQNCMRAGADLAVRKARLGSQLQAAQDAAVNALKAGSAQHRCLAAVVGGVLFSGAASSAAFEEALNGISSICKDTGLRALGKGGALTCGQGSEWENAACAAAEGLSGNDDPVTSILMANAGDSDYTSLYYSYMLYIVSAQRYAQGSSPTFYPSVGAPIVDVGIVSPPLTDQAGLPSNEKGGTARDVKVRRSESGAILPGGEHSQNALSGGSLEGGCSMARGMEDLLPMLLLLVSGVLVLRRWR
jgi:hypothetical protein